MNDDFKLPLSAPVDPELPTMGMSSVYRLFEAFIALREKNERQHKLFEQTLNRARDGLQSSFNTFAGDTQKAFQSLRQEILGEKKFSLALLNVILDLGIDMNHILDSQPKQLPTGAEGEAVQAWIKSLEVENRKIWDDIRKFGITPYEAAFGTPYNPAMHERVGSTRVDGLPALMIAETREKGYASQQPEFILRRPKVIVTEWRVMIPWLDELGHSWWVYAQMAFTVGMLVHAYRSSAEILWYWVILFFQPFGAWIYFFAVFLRNVRFGRGVSTGPLWQKKLSLDELRYRAERTPTVVNRMALAQRLMEKGLHTEAIPLLEAVMAADDIYCQPMHDLAVCHLAGKEPAKAVALLKRLLQRDYRWSHYLAWRTLIDAHSACNEPAEALKACRELEKMVPTLENKCRLAEHLLDNHLQSEAIELLDQALEDHAYAPLNKRLKNWRWARLAQRLLKEAETKA